MDPGINAIFLGPFRIFVILLWRAEPGFKSLNKKIIRKCRGKMSVNTDFILCSLRWCLSICTSKTWSTIRAQEASQNCSLTSPSRSNIPAWWVGSSLLECSYFSFLVFRSVWVTVAPFLSLPLGPKPSTWYAWSCHLEFSRYFLADSLSGSARLSNSSDCGGMASATQTNESADWTAMRPDRISDQRMIKRMGNGGFCEGPAYRNLHSDDGFLYDCTKTSESACIQEALQDASITEDHCTPWSLITEWHGNEMVVRYTQYLLRTVIIGSSTSLRFSVPVAFQVV